MPGSAEFIQRMVHTFETGEPAVWIRRALIVAGIGGLSLFYLLHEFRGLATSQAMDQAQIGREIARGHGWQTHLARPLAIGQLLSHGKNVPQKIWYDTFNAPLPPLVNAIALFPVKNHLKMGPADTIYAGDRAIAAMSIFLFLCSIVVLFFVARRLFDQRLATMACALVLLGDMFWEYSLSGLPQMLLLFLFNCTVYTLLRAVESQSEGGRVGAWLALAGLGFGLLALSHALTIWIFAAALIFCVFFFRPRGWAALIIFTVFAVVYFPWLIRTYAICGNPGGLAIYSALDGIGHTETGWMRRIGFTLEGAGPKAFRDKMVGNFLMQWGQLFGYLGWSVVALGFFAGLLYIFKRPQTSIIRWMILAMWGGAVAGMTVFGINQEEGVAANQLHLIFVPLMTCYGLAYLLVQWNWLEIHLRAARIGFILLLFILCSAPTLCRLPGLKPPELYIHWPPYIPPYIAVLNGWMQPNEVTASDMPWAVAWYADRRAIYVPETVKVMSDLSDYGMLGGPIYGLYMTPISGSQNKMEDILKGEYKEWAPVISRTVNLETFPLKWGILLGLENECIFLSDRNRQAPSAPPP
ncbi:MAG: glycosyltransferase family 39 protein [Verrucomicrobiota bacterium]